MTRNEWNDLTPERLDQCAAASPWEALEHAAALLTHERLDQCAAARPWAALEHAAALLTPERLRLIGLEWLAPTVVRSIVDKMDWCEDGASEWLEKWHGTDCQEISRTDLRTAAEKAGDCRYAKIILRLLDRAEKIEAGE